MPLKRFNPKKIAPPNSPTYHHGIEATPNMRWLTIAGQIGRGPDGKTPASFEAQCEIAWDNILAILAESGMGPQDLVKTTTFLTRKEDIVASRNVRVKKLGDAPACASTLLVISALAAPEFLVEIEATAAKD
ncbi:MAG: RidA family protein [Proteobacteria bacterium]|nr:RidA family protein [Pseudomonadota bacterium]